MSATEGKSKPAVPTYWGAVKWWFLYGLHHVYLGNLLKGVLFTVFIDPMPNMTWWFLSGPIIFRKYYKELVRQANDDPTYDDEIKEKIKAGSRPPFEILNHIYASSMNLGIIKFMIFVFKYNVFPDWPNSVATLVYLMTGMTCAYCVWAATATKWAQGNLTAAMGAGLVSTVAMIFLDKGAPPTYVRNLITVRDWSVPVACGLTRTYKKTPSKVTTGSTAKDKKIAFYLVLILFPTNLIVTNNWVRNGTYQLLSGQVLNHGIPFAETHHVVKTFAKGSYVQAARMALLHINVKDRVRRKKAEKMIATFYAEVYKPFDEEEMTPLKARALLEVEVGADDKKIRRAYRDASRKWHPDKHPNDVQMAEAMQEKVGAAKTVLGYYNDRYNDGLVYCDEFRNWWLGRRSKFSAQPEQKEQKTIHMSKEEYIKYLAENACDELKGMYNAVYLQDLMDLGEDPDCTTLAENIQILQTAYQTGQVPETTPEEAAAAPAEGAAEEAAPAE